MQSVFTGPVYVVRDNIDTDQIIPAQYLNLVPTIAEEYEVSRMPVREALRQLEALGLIEMKTHRGAVVTALGASTYPLYLFHDKVGVVLAQHVPWLRGVFGLAVLLALFIAVAVLFARYVEPRLIAGMRNTLRRLLGVAKPTRTG